MEWINAVAQRPDALPKRILVAGCGTGNEAFALCDRFPQADIVGFDFSPLAIAIARRAQRRVPRFRRIHFLVGDLTKRSCLAQAGPTFEFISCHGVVSYLEKPAQVLRNLTRHLSPGGALYLGVNGAAHLSATWRSVLPEFGIRTTALPRGKGFRDFLELCELLTGFPLNAISGKDDAYLASDLFGPLICNRSLAAWVSIANKAGLHFRSNHIVQRHLWPAINHGGIELLRPRTRGEVAGIIDRLNPGGFHQLVFTREAEGAAPWDNLRDLLSWRPLLAPHLAKQRWPRVACSNVAMQGLTLKTPATNTRIDLKIPEWEVEILRRAQGKLSLRCILGPKFAPSSLSRRLYVLYQLNLLNLLPPLRSAD